jgi:monovalent cation/hydrogen antiporter
LRGVESADLLLEEAVLEVLTTILVILAAVVASSAIARTRLAPVPLPFVQIGLGAIVAVMFNLNISLPPDIFLLLFIAPLLFLDGWRIPKEGLLRDRWTIVALAFGLVVFTVVGAGYFIHWMIPAMPLAVAFALAAVLSPTDAVAVSAIAVRNPMPKRLMHILEGESLLNDASGLVCLQFAVQAALTGTFFIGKAVESFVWLAAGGIAIGIALTLLANGVKDWISAHLGEEIGAQILTSLLIPFCAYVLAEHFGASGILAAVAAGVVMSYEERSGRASAMTRVRRAAVWDAVQFAGNGAIFVLLGYQLPGIVSGAGKAIGQTGRQDELWLLLYVVAIGCVLTILRALWARATLGLILYRAAAVRPQVQDPGWRVIAVTSLAGVRGAVTLSGVMTLPLALPDGSPFPTRDLAILLAAGTILISLIAANVALPRLLKGVKFPAETSGQQEQNARLAAAQAAIRAIERHSREIGGEDSDLYLRAAAKVAAQYQQRIDTHLEMGQDTSRARIVDKIERNLHLLALHAERDELYTKARSGELRDEVARMLVREVDLQETRLSMR